MYIICTTKVQHPSHMGWAPHIMGWKMLDLQHQYNNCTTISHMRVSPTYWGPLSCEGLLYSCCIGVVQESNPLWGPPHVREVLYTCCTCGVRESPLIKERLLYF
jgi:hypothetical protein